MINSINDRVKLNNGTSMPWLGIGVFKMTDEEARDAVLAALDVGYRSIDTAAVYKNEPGVARALQETGIAREDLFLTTKAWNDDQRESRVMQAFEESLERLGTDYVDLYLVHWPVRDRSVETWQVMEEILASGRARAIGVSNYLPHHLKEILAVAKSVPAVNQVEFHPYLVQSELLAFCKEHDIVPEAWSPLMQGRAMSDDTILRIAAKYGKTAAQIVLRWNLQHGVVTIPKSVRPARIAENAAIFDFNLADEDMRTLDGLDEGARIGPDPDKFGF